jgi:transposase InsO family protein
MHSLAVDTIGPLPEDEKGNKYIIAVIDIFSRFLEMHPAPDATAVSAADALLQHTGRYGIPSLLISDAGSQYVNEIISELLKMMGSDHQVTLAHSKQENGIIERSNKEILRQELQVGESRQVTDEEIRKVFELKKCMVKLNNNK